MDIVEKRVTNEAGEEEGLSVVDAADADHRLSVIDELMRTNTNSSDMLFSDDSFKLEDHGANANNDKKENTRSESYSEHSKLAGEIVIAEHENMQEEKMEEDTLKADKVNRHSRKISWGDDLIMGKSGNAAKNGDDKNNTSDVPPRVENPTPLPNWHRKASSSIDFTAIRPLFTRNRQSSDASKVSMEDVLQTSPMETEAETYILKALEHRDPTRNRKESIAEDSGVFPDMAEDAVSALSGNEMSPPSSGRVLVAGEGQHLGLGASARRLRLAKKQAHRRSQTMEEQLFQLSSAIDTLQTQNWSVAYEKAGIPEPFSTINITQEPGNTSAEVLQQNASLLYKRASHRRLFSNSNVEYDGNDSKKPISSSERYNSNPPASSNGNSLTPSLESSSGLPSNASSRWRTLRSAVMATANLAQTGSEHHKKTDGDSARFSQGTSNNNIEEEILFDIEEGKTESVDSENNKNDDKVGIDDPEVSAKVKKERWLFREFQDFFAPRKNSIALYLRVAIFYFGMTLVGTAAILFYLAGNPPIGILANGGKPINGTLYNTDGEVVDPNKASASWWLLYIFRQIVCLTLAKFMEILFIDYMAIRSRGSVNVFGPWVTLFILQSRGWPSNLVFWAIFNFGLLAGSRPFFDHWLYYAEIGLFNNTNPSGKVVDSEWYHRILAIAISVGLIVSFKRLLLGLYLGRRTFSQFSDQLSSVMKKILMISEVAALSKDIEREVKLRAIRKGVSKSIYVAQLKGQREKLFGIFDEVDEDGVSTAGVSVSQSQVSALGQIIDPEDRNPWSGTLSYSQQMKITQLLGAWEEPVIAEKKIEYISVNALLQFRRSMACLHTLFPFSGSFGLADSRENCIESAQEVYGRLLLNNPDGQGLNFETLALLGVERDGSLDHAKLKELIRLFRPNRNGSLSILEFVKSIDSVYKEIRLLRASVANASKIDKAFENIFNIIFYAIMISVILSQVGYSPLALFLSISGVILAFAFMIGSASSKYFEGLLFILVRRPYAIGDGIHVSGPETEGIFTGHPFWYVEDVTLFTTSVMFMYTGERATLSNGSLANSRIVNSSRSPVAYMYVLLKFPVDVTHEKLKIFDSALEEYFKNRPREWKSYDSFRTTRIDAQAGFIEYMVVCTHRCSWVEWVPIHVSKADLIHFCNELSKQLDIKYRTPPVPIDMTVESGFPFMTDIPKNQASGIIPKNQESGIMNIPVNRQPDLSSLQAMFPPRIS